MRDIDDERYRIPLPNGGYAINLSKWSRENVPKPPPKYKVGDVVIYTTETEIVQVYSDCDGTPLYQVAANGYGVGEHSLKVVT